jgi:hypothetical protein
MLSDSRAACDPDGPETFEGTLMDGLEEEPAVSDDAMTAIIASRRRCRLPLSPCPEPRLASTP